MVNTLNSKMRMLTQSAAITRDERFTAMKTRLFLP